MRMPVRHIAGHIVWSRHGTQWAVFRVQGADHIHASRAARLRRLHAMESLVKKLVGESMWLSLCPQVDPASVVEKMLAGVDEHASDRYIELCHRVLDELEQLELTGRTDWLAVPLPTVGWRNTARAVLSAAAAEMAGSLGILPAPVSAAEEAARLEEAAKLAAAWPTTVKLRPATEAEILWIYGHAARRGVNEPLLPQPDAPRGVRGRGRGVAGLGQVLLTEGGLPGDPGTGRERTRSTGDAFRRRWLEVRTEFSSSYQAHLVLSEMPERFLFPGSEYLAALGEYAFPVDWVVRLHVTPGAKAEAKSRRQAKELAGQPEEYTGNAAGVPASVDRAADQVAEFRDRLTSSASEVEVRAMVALCTWGATPEEAEERAAMLVTDFAGDEYQLVRPVGEQEALFYGMLPAARTPPVMTQYAQFLLARDLCMAGPFADTALGDEDGPLYGLQLTGGGARPVHVDWSRGPKKKASASAAFIGELGGGKSVAMKAAVYSVLAAGRKRGLPGSRGRSVIVDRTPQQEWLRFARACPGSTQVITIDKDAAVSLDPLRIFTQARDGVRPDLAEAQRFSESFLGMLLGIRPMDDLGDALSDAIEAVLNRPEPSVARLQKELTGRGDAGDTASATLARKLRTHARKDLAKAVFDETLPVVDAAADSVVFSVANLALPKERELQAGQFEKLSPEKVFGRAALYLIAAMCRRTAFDPGKPTGEFTLVVWDECWWLTSSPEGLELLLELVRDGRKHDAGVLVGSHDADDIGPSDSDVGLVLRGLFPRRHLFRHTDPVLAKRGLAFLGLDASDDELITLVTSQLSPLHESDEIQALRAGECLVRDLYGRVGGMRVLIPLDEEAAKAIHSDPVLQDV